MLISIGMKWKISLNHSLTNIQKIIFILPFFSVYKEKVGSRLTKLNSGSYLNITQFSTYSSIYQYVLLKKYSHNNFFHMTQNIIYIFNPFPPYPHFYDQVLPYICIPWNSFSQTLSSNGTVKRIHEQCHGKAKRTPTVYGCLKLSFSKRA